MVAGPQYATITRKSSIDLCALASKGIRCRLYKKMKFCALSTQICSGRTLHSIELYDFVLVYGP